MRRDERPHAIAWWLFAAGLAAAALRCSNPLLLLGLGAVAVAVALLRRGDAPWSASIGSFVRVGLLVIVLRLLLEMVFGQRLPGHVLFRLPSVPLPSWAAGVSIGGPVTVESLLAALVGGLRLAVVLVAFGAANSLASPRELLRSLPGMFHELAVAITVALCFAPELLASVRRVHDARRLRGRPTKGVAGLRGIAVPVLEEALERSVQLAASMGSRGFGRRGPASGLLRRRTSMGLLILGGVLALVGTYGALSADRSVPAAWALLVLGALGLALGTFLGSRRSERSRYRPAPFGLRSTACALLGWLPLLSFVLAGAQGEAGVTWSPYPLAWPSAPPLAVVGIAASLLVLALSPAPERVAREAVVA